MSRTDDIRENLNPKVTSSAMKADVRYLQISMLSTVTLLDLMLQS